MIQLVRDFSPEAYSDSATSARSTAAHRIGRGFARAPEAASRKRHPSTLLAVATGGEEEE
jgi:hypothetical protein